ncbi:serine protease snake-like isoform X1 [Zophobas morio]|uniref:serine protease snake-like isoform X1 n=1 Tax=Zophobas morio TaxID=2755281 RepID=UPI003083DB75
MRTVLSLFTAIFLGAVCCQKLIGDICIIKSTGAKGACTLFANCEKARVDLKQYFRFPQVCGFQETQLIVCCTPRRIPGEISKAKCEEYSRYVYKTSVPPIALYDAKPVTRNECGHQVTKLIVGGEAAGRKEFPHMAAIGYDSPGEGIKWLCGGTILSERYVLTAAHCLSDHNAGNALWVRLGVTNLNSTYRRQEIKISERIPHPEYKPNSYYHDIGLLRLEKEAQLNSYSRPACLYLDSKITKKRAIATGWGHTSFNGATSNDLLKVVLDLFDQSTCGAYYQNYRKVSQGILDNLQVCAGSVDATKDTCQGDSGGPLQIYHTDNKIKCMYDIIGVTSFGRGCAGSPGVYVRISNYIKWIEDIVWPQE